MCPVRAQCPTSSSYARAPLGCALCVLVCVPFFPPPSFSIALPNLLHPTRLEPPDLHEALERARPLPARALPECVFICPSIPPPLVPPPLPPSLSVKSFYPTPFCARTRNAATPRSGPLGRPVRRHGCLCARARFALQRARRPRPPTNYMNMLVPPVFPPAPPPPLPGAPAWCHPPLHSPPPARHRVCVPPPPQGLCCCHRPPPLPLLSLLPRAPFFFEESLGARCKKKETNPLRHLFNPPRPPPVCLFVSSPRSP